MVRINVVLAAVVCAAVALQAVRGDDACYAELSGLQAAQAACKQQATELQQQLETLKGELVAAGGKASKAEGELDAALDRAENLEQELRSLEDELKNSEKELGDSKGKLSSTQSKVTALEADLSSAQSKLKSAAAELAAAQKELASAKASAEQGSTCHRKLTKVESKLSEHAARLEELKAVEDALLPVWLSRRVDSSVSYASAQWQQLQQSDIAAQVHPHWEKFLEMTKPAREAAAEYLAKGQEALSKLPVSDTIDAVKAQLATIERELLLVVQGIVKTQPALSGLNDPVTLQLLVYSIMGLPMLLLAMLVVSLYGGPGKSSGADAAAASKQSSKGKAAAAAASKKAGPAKGGKAAVPQTPAGKKGKTVKDGADVLYTP